MNRNVAKRCSKAAVIALMFASGLCTEVARAQPSGDAGITWAAAPAQDFSTNGICGMEQGSGGALHGRTVELRAAWRNLRRVLFPASAPMHAAPGASQRHAAKGMRWGVLVGGGNVMFALGRPW